MGSRSATVSAGPMPAARRRRCRASRRSAHRAGSSAAWRRRPPAGGIRKVFMGRDPHGLLCERRRSAAGIKTRRETLGPEGSGRPGTRHGSRRSSGPAGSDSCRRRAKMNQMTSDSRMPAGTEIHSLRRPKAAAVAANSTPVAIEKPPSSTAASALPDRRRSRPPGPSPDARARETHRERRRPRSRWTARSGRSPPHREWSWARRANRRPGRRGAMYPTGSRRRWRPAPRRPQAPPNPGGAVLRKRGPCRSFHQSNVLEGGFGGCDVLGQLLIEGRPAR